MKVFSCIAILVSLLSLVSCCCLPAKSASWDCKTRKMDQLMDKMDYLLEKKLEMKSKLQMYKNMQQAIGFCGKLPCNCEFVFGNPIEQCRPQQYGGCCRY